MLSNTSSFGQGVVQEAPRAKRPRTDSSEECERAYRPHSCEDVDLAASLLSLSPSTNSTALAKCVSLLNTPDLATIASEHRPDLGWIDPREAQALWSTQWRRSPHGRSTFAGPSAFARAHPYAAGGLTASQMESLQGVDLEPSPGHSSCEIGATPTTNEAMVWAGWKSADGWGAGSRAPSRPP